MADFLPFEIIAALRFLREGLMQTLLIIVGVAVGVSVIVFMSALLNGVQANILNRLLSTQAQVVILPAKDINRPVMQAADTRFLRVVESRTQRQVTVDQWRKLAAALVRTAGVSVVSPMVSGPAIVVRGAATRSVTFTGVEPDQYYRFVDIPGDIVSGTARITGQDALFGKDLADDLGLRVGDKVLVRNSTGGSQALTLAGIFDLGNKGFNQRIVLAQLGTAQNLLGLAGNVTSIDVTLQDPYASNDVADSLTAVHKVKADSWIRTNAQFFSAMNTQNVSFSAIRGSVAVSIVLGIASVLVVSVVQRSKEIGILRAMGASQGQIMRVFLVQGGVVGFIGSILGSLLARGFTQLWQVLAVNPDGTPFFAVAIHPGLYAATALAATFCGVLAASVPARRASRLDPVVAIRG